MHHLAGLYQVCLNYAPPQWSHALHRLIWRKQYDLMGLYQVYATGTKTGQKRLYLDRHMLYVGLYRENMRLFTCMKMQGLESLYY